MNRHGRAGPASPTRGPRYRREAPPPLPRTPRCRGDQSHTRREAGRLPRAWTRPREVLAVTVKPRGEDGGHLVPGRGSSGKPPPPTRPHTGSAGADPRSGSGGGPVTPVWASARTLPWGPRPGWGRAHSPAGPWLAVAQCESEGHTRGPSEASPEAGRAEGDRDAVLWPWWWRLDPALDWSLRSADGFSTPLKPTRVGFPVTCNPEDPTYWDHSQTTPPRRRGHPERSRGSSRGREEEGTRPVCPRPCWQGRQSWLWGARPRRGPGSPSRSLGCGRGAPSRHPHAHLLRESHPGPRRGSRDVLSLYPGTSYDIQGARPSCCPSSRRDIASDMENEMKRSRCEDLSWLRGSARRPPRRPRRLRSALDAPGLRARPHGQGQAAAETTGDGAAYICDSS